jgi:dihydrodipicolinate synthase/N-acetylneuraminate lyase
MTTEPRIRPCALATVCVPWEADGTFDETTFRRQIRSLRDAGVEDLYLFGTAGEGYAVTDELFRRIATTFLDETAGRGGLRQLGVISLSTLQARQRIEIGLELGCEAFQVSFPAWTPLSDAEVHRYFREVVGSYPRATFLLYNTARSGRVLPASTIRELAGQFPNFAATKSGGHTAAELLGLADTGGVLPFLTELDFIAARLLGIECGLLVSVAAICPPIINELFDASRAGQESSLRGLATEIHAIRSRLIETVSATGGHVDGAFDKVIARLLDPAFPLRLLGPYQDAGEAAWKDLRDWIAKQYPRWLERTGVSGPQNTSSPGNF